MSSHREAPAIARTRSPTAPTLYAFVSPTIPPPSRSSPTTCRWRRRRRAELLRVRRRRPLRINIDNDGDGDPDIMYEFTFETRSPTRTRSSTTPARSARSTARTGTASSSTRVTRIDAAGSPGARSQPALPAVQHRSAARPRTTRRWPRRRSTAPGRPDGVRGPAAEGFYVDLGAIFDLGDLRPFEKLHRFGTALPQRVGVNAHQRVQRPLDRAAGPDRGSDAGRRDADRPVLRRR